MRASDHLSCVYKAQFYRVVIHLIGAGRSSVCGVLDTLLRILVLVHTGSGSGGRGGNGSSNGNGNGSAGSSPLRLPSIEGGDDDDELYRGMGS